MSGVAQRHPVRLGLLQPLGVKLNRLAGDRAVEDPSDVNDAQDAMGFRAAITAGHSSYMIASLGGVFFDEENPFGSRKRMPGVDSARRRHAERRQAAEGGAAPAT